MQESTSQAALATAPGTCPNTQAAADELSARKLAVPTYLQDVYWWAYVHPNAVQVFERDWLVNLILWGNYKKLTDVVLDTLGDTIQGSLLQVACAYGNITPRIVERLAPDARLDVVDILPIQLKNLASKLAPDDRVAMLQGDSAALACPDASYDQVLLFFLLHEQPESVRRATLSEALRVVKPGGRITIIDYHGPKRSHPLYLPMVLILKTLEPFAMDLWGHDIASFLPEGQTYQHLSKTTYFGGLYQQVVITR